MTQIEGFHEFANNIGFAIVHVFLCGHPASDKALYVAYGVVAGAPEGHCARMPPEAAHVTRSTGLVRGRGGVGTSSAVHLPSVIQNRGDLNKFRREMLCNTGYVRGDTSCLNVGLYGYDGIRVERTGGIRAGRRP